MKIKNRPVQFFFLLYTFHILKVFHVSILFTHSVLYILIKQFVFCAWQNIETFLFIGLPLVVEKFHSFWRLSSIHFRLLILLFYEQTGNNRIYSHFVVHRVHGFNGIHLLATYWYHRIFCSIRIRPENLCSCQNRLNPILFSKLWMYDVLLYYNEFVVYFCDGFF